MAKKGGKYAGVIDKLPKAPMVETERRDIVQAVKDAILAPPSEDEVIYPPEEATAEARRLTEEIAKKFRLLLAIEKRATAGRRYATEFARLYAELRDVADEMDSWWKSLNLLLEAYQWVMLEQMEVEGLSSLKMASGRGVSTFLKPYATVKDKETFRQWLLRQRSVTPLLNERGGVVTDSFTGEPIMVLGPSIFESQMTLHPSTVQSLASEMLLAGENPPDGVEIFAKPQIRLGSE